MMERLPEIIPVAPTITRNEMSFEWNHEAVKEYLTTVTEKYIGLVVTDENLKDMEKARREIVRLRTAISKFKADGKRKMQEPANRFAHQCDELIAVVEDVEAPISMQLSKYEDARKARLTESITREYQMKASAMGLDMAYWQLDMKKEWFNKTAKWSDTCCAIDSLILSQLEKQKADDEEAPKTVQDASETVEDEITQAEAKGSTEGKLCNSTAVQDSYLLITISFTAKKQDEERLRSYAKELEESICGFGAFPIVSIEEAGR